jgi:hypothetical protein
LLFIPAVNDIGRNIHGRDLPSLNAGGCWA